MRLAQRHVLFREPNNLTPIGMRALEAGKKRLKCMAILGRNLHTLGRLLIAQQAPKSLAAQSQRKAA